MSGSSISSEEPPDPTATTVSQWLIDRPGIEAICPGPGRCLRRRGPAPGPDALQVADRWHLWHNLGETVEKVVRHHHDALSNQDS
jgi:hypothetical protein